MHDVLRVFLFLKLTSTLMKKKLKAAFTLALLMGIALVGQAQNGIKLNLKKGDKFKIEYKVANLTYMTQADNKAAINTEDILGSTYEITDVNQNIYSIKITFDYIKFQITPPKGMEDNGQSGFFDSRKPEDMEGDFGVNAKEVIGKSVAFTYDAVAKKLISVDHTLSVELTPMQVGPAVGMFPMTEDYLKAMAPKVFGGICLQMQNWKKAMNGKLKNLSRTTELNQTASNIPALQAPSLENFLSNWK
jgi:hypothetical protein